jgi:NADPH:quinone reductase-like Zn-dependent oxidoreductase
VVLQEVKPGSANLATLRELVESGQVTPVIDRRYPLRETAEAIRYVEVEHARAKVVITV